MEELITLVKELKAATTNWNAKCKKRFYFSDVVLPGEEEPHHRVDTGLYLTVRKIELLADLHLICRDGSDLANEIKLELKAGVKFITLDRDAFGPLRKGILIGHGLICYG